MAPQSLLLEIQTGKHKGRKVRLAEAEVIVGRGDEAGIRIASAEVSREHCKLIPQNGKILVIDLNSRNGTFVDGRPVDGMRWLRPGGSLTVGPLTFTLIGNEESASSPPSAVALKGKKAATDKLSDDEIVDWLSDSELPAATGNAATETSIIKHSPTAATVDSTTPASPDILPAQPVDVFLSPPQIPASKRREFKSVAEEAQDIIRRHFEMLALEEAEHPSK